MVSVREFDGLRDPILSFGDCAAEIAAADTELDGDKALAALAIDKRSAGIERDICEFTEWDVRICPGGCLIGHLHGADGVNSAAILGIESDGQTELPITFENGCRRGAPKCSLNNGIDVTSIETVARGFFAIDLDVEIGLTQQVKYSKVGNATDLRHLGHHLSRK